MHPRVIDEIRYMNFNNLVHNIINEASTVPINFERIWYTMLWQDRIEGGDIEVTELGFTPDQRNFPAKLNHVYYCYSGPGGNWNTSGDWDIIDRTKTYPSIQAVRKIETENELDEGNWDKKRYYFDEDGFYVQALPTFDHKLRITPKNLT